MDISTMTIENTPETKRNSVNKKWLGGIVFVTVVTIYTLNKTSLLEPFRGSSPTFIKDELHHNQNIIKGENLSIEENKIIPFNPLYLGVIDAEMGWTPYMDFIDEETALRDPQITDTRKQVNIKKSRVYILGRTRGYKVGDTVRVRIDLNDGYGIPRQRGGDQLRVRIFEKSRGASASGYVVDHYNGSYTAIVKCLWVGSPTLLIFISYTREAIRALYYIRKRRLATRHTGVLYADGETKLCHPFASSLGNSSQLCNMTSLNGNMSWYCRSPENHNCSSMKYFLKIPKLHFTKAEGNLFKRNMEHMVPSLNIRIIDNRLSRDSIHKKPPCSSFNRTKLWFQASPTGHFMKNKWKPEHCASPPVERFESCLRNKHLIIYGDSTTRQWFTNIMGRYKCRMTSERWTYGAWKMDSAVFCEKNNLTLEWIVHSFPGNTDERRVRANSIALHMLNFANDKNAIFVIHLLCHLSLYHHDVFRDRISHIRKSVDAVLKANKDAKILIKGGHTFGNKLMVISDYYTYVYRAIEIEEFKGLYDKVTYLDYKDMTIANETVPNHPEENMVTEMVNQMLSYICN